MVFHLWTNAKALGGQAPFDAAVQEINHTPYLPVLEWGLILLPLLFHAVYGVVLAFEARYNVAKYNTSRNWAYTLQRATGILAFLFIIFHMYGFWWKKLMGNMEPDRFYPELSAQMSSSWHGLPVMALVYILGIAACTFHFANGLWGFCFSWGVTISKRSQQMAAWVFGIVGAAVFFLGANTIIHFATGKGLFEDQFFNKSEKVETPPRLDNAGEVSKPPTTQSPVVP